MRNPDRIDSFLDELGKLWKENCPNWRFGQLIINVFDASSSSMFIVEDDRMLEYFKKYFNK